MPRDRFTVPRFLGRRSVRISEEVEEDFSAAAGYQAVIAALVLRMGGTVSLWQSEIDALQTGGFDLVSSHHFSPGDIAPSGLTIEVFRPEGDKK